MACEELECDGVTQEAEQLTASFYHALLAEHEQGRQVVLILDEADTIPRETLEYLLGLAHRRAATGKPLLQIILAVFGHFGSMAMACSYSLSRGPSDVCDACPFHL